ncbi:cyclic pyranopterin monophosphate synthase subunit MoaA [Abditibacterium utsteinense]|uniref:GTP 3',8-cyclase n=1 Tax=Abditibacterium utsteinense TaxID=1960156 RepID=A0A2S8STC8_9BACT|nr:GTP 3',8-cyclase MoaA [Abditibacterium utsteinense]PQV64036.1 cyclic pyranopterin monophosphate synthase subunit MoaA [Abditibacterium utsteinense]
MLQDRFQRLISYLRISVTDRCNFRCVYCMPEAGVEVSPREEILSFEEIARIARVGATLGLSKIRLTGGEPTVRRDLPTLVSMLRAIPEIKEIAMTTNAALLDNLAIPLKNAGMNRLNISLDTLSHKKSREIARRDEFERVLAGIDAAKCAGLGIKFNTVVMRGLNDDELPDLLEFARSYDAQIRFIEYMPMGMARFDERNRLVSATQMREILSSKFDLVPEAENGDPARGYVCNRTGARAGFISSMSDHFCDSCNRMRLTALGGLRPCLHQNAEVDARAILRNGGSDEDLQAAFLEAAGLKWAGHRMNDIIPLFSSKDMVSIGG